MVMNYVKDGYLPNFLTKKKKKLYKKYKLRENNLNFSLELWKYKIIILHRISAGLKRIHNRKLIYRDLHVEDPVCNNCITDMGLCKPENNKKSENVENNIYSVLLYLAPEILRGQDCTQFSDIYSFGVTMYETISELTSYHDNDVHGLCLALDNCEELNPEINIKIPQLLLDLIKRCLDVNPLNRPNANDLLKPFDKWLKELNKYIKSIENQTEAAKIGLVKQIIEMEKVEDINENPSPNNSTSPPEPKNSDDHYEIYDNISDIEYSEYSGIK
jgi:serine/threonine protein kinase